MPWSWVSSPRRASLTWPPTGDYDAGIMVSASHNPAQDNGLKVVSGGRKVDDEAEDQLEHLIFQAESLPRPANGDVGTIGRDPSAVDGYRAHLTEAAGDAFQRTAHRDRLRQRVRERHRSRPVPRAGRGGHRAMRGSGRFEHQRRLRIDAARGFGAPGGGEGPGPGVRLRRRRGPPDRGRRARRDRGRRRGDGRLRARSARCRDAGARACWWSRS